MGIDIYLEWKGMVPGEKDKQITGFSTTSGHVGYLREAYHGGPYVTQMLVREAFESDNGRAFIPAVKLRARLKVAKRLAKERALLVYNEALEDDDPQVKAFEEFVRLAELKEKETGEPCLVIASY